MLSMKDKSTTGEPFQADIKNVALASSLQIVVKEAILPGGEELVILLSL